MDLGISSIRILEVWLVSGCLAILLCLALLLTSMCSTCLKATIVNLVEVPVSKGGVGSRLVGSGLLTAWLVNLNQSAWVDR